MYNFGRKHNYAESQINQKLLKGLLKKSSEETAEQATLAELLWDISYLNRNICLFNYQILLQAYSQAESTVQYSLSQVSNTRGGCNKRVGWKFSSNLINGQALITVGRVEIFFICVGEKTGKLEIFFKINKSNCTHFFQAQACFH